MKIKALVLMLLAVVFASGCSLGATPPAGNEVLQEGLTNLYYEATSAKFDMSLKGDITAPEGETPEKISFNVKFSGDMDNEKPSEPKFNLRLNGSAKWDEIKDQMFDAELRSNSKYLFFSLKDIGDFDGMLPKEMVSEFLGKWYKMPIPEDTFEALDKKSDMSEEEIAIQKLAKESNFMKDIKYEGTKKIMGTESYVYSASLDKDAIVNFASELAKMDGAELSTSEIRDLEEQLKMFDLSGKFYVGVKDKILRGAEGVLTLDVEGAKGSIEFKLEIGDINKSFKVDEPKDAEEFDPMMLLGGAMMMDDSYGDYDMSGYEDFDMSQFEDFDMGEYEDFDMSQFEEMNF